MPFIPLYDRNPRVLVARPWVTWGLIVMSSAIYVAQISAGTGGNERLIFGLGLIPATLSGDAELGAHLYLISPVMTLITYMFLHGGLLHLGGNMLFLWVFGDNIEDAMGHRRFIAFYLLGGIAAGLLQVLIDPLSRSPTIGASGAIAAVLGAYLMLHPRAKILVPIIIFPVYIPAVFLLVFWIGFQIYTALNGAPGSVAWWAHIGGFFAGVVLIVPMRHNSLPLFGVGDLPGGLTLRRGYRRHSGGKDDRRDHE